jgi:hypothetical protein
MVAPPPLGGLEKPPTGSPDGKDDVAESHSRVRSWATIAAFTLIIALTVAEGVDEGFSFWDLLASRSARCSSSRLSYA